jgi:hypothetical protein
MFAADSNCFDVNAFEDIRTLVGAMDVLFVGTVTEGAPLTFVNGPLLSRAVSRAEAAARTTHGSDSAGVLKMIDALGARRVFVYAMGFERWMNHLVGPAFADDSGPVVHARRVIEGARARSLDDAVILRDPSEFVLPTPR